MVQFGVTVRLTLLRVLHFSTVLHLCAASCERYDAIFKNPLSYDERITKKRAIVNITLLWVIPAVLSLGPFIKWGDYVYDAEIFACGQKWDVQTTLPLLIGTFLVPLGVIIFLNYRVLKVVRRIQRSIKMIPVQPDDQDQQENRDADHSRRYQQELRDQRRNNDGKTPKVSQIHNAIEFDPLEKDSGGRERPTISPPSKNSPKKPMKPIVSTWRRSLAKAERRFHLNLVALAR